MEDLKTTEVKKTSVEVDDQDCAVCLQTCVQPVKLSCQHIFCYLCVKGIQNRRCPMCRQDIPASFLNKPTLLEDVPQTCVAFEGSYQWYYQGRNGWWQYDDRTSTDIEAAFKKGDTKCEVMIAGFFYTIDFQRNMQERKDNPVMRRHIKRDLVTIPKKGVAGIRHPSQKNPDEASTSACADIEPDAKRQKTSMQELLDDSLSSLRSLMQSTERALIDMRKSQLELQTQQIALFEKILKKE